MDFLKLLNNSYLIESAEYKQSKFEYLGGHFFNFTTYENIVLEKMTIKAIEVCNAITNKTTFDYIEDDENNLWYLIMVNMPFFKGKLNWGTSIRGAWWDIYEHSSKLFTIDSCGLFDGNKQVLNLQLDFYDWHMFLSSINKFISNPPTKSKESK